MSASESQLREVLETLPAAAYICDAHGLITYFNQQAAELWGREPKLLDESDRYCGSFRLFSTDGFPLPHERSWMALTLQNRREYGGEEVVLERPDGSRVTALAHAKPIIDDAGELLGAVNILIDISDRKAAEEAQTRLAAIVSSSDDAIIGLALDGHILTWNAGARRLFGYTEAETIGRPIAMLIPPDRREADRAILAKICRGEHVDHYATVRFAKDGHPIDVSLTVSPLRDRSGQLIGAAKIARDVTAQKQAERTLVQLTGELAQQVADLRRLQEMSVQLTTTYDLQPILDETLRTATAIAKTPRGVLAVYDPETGRLRLGATLGFDEASRAAVAAISPSGGSCSAAYAERRRVIVEDVEADPLFAPHREAARLAGFRAVHSTPLTTRSGECVGILTLHFPKPHHPSDRETNLIDLCARQAVDFIENSRLYNRLKEADRHKEEFLATLAHELSNPLAPLGNSLNILQLAGDLSPTAERVCEVMERQLKHMVRLVDDSREVSRVARGKLEVRKEAIELAAVVRNAVETSMPMIEANRHQLAISIPPEPITLVGDPVRLAQVVSNLLNNSAKYTEPGGQIWLQVSVEGDEAVLLVRDTGLGIPSEMLPRIFDMFSQSSRTLTRSQGGLGIGLTLARSLVQMHGGRIEAHSEGPGRGSEFIVHIPLTPAAALQDATTTIELSYKPPGSHRILVVDDSPAASSTFGELLKMMGQNVRIAHNGATALKLAREERPELIISDIEMPEMNGYELARRVRNDPELAGIYLAALTGYGEERDIQTACDAGFDMHLVKPVSIHNLRELLAKLPAPQPGPSTFGAADQPSVTQTS